MNKLIKLPTPILQLSHLVLVAGMFWLYSKAVGITKISADDTRLVIFACLTSIFYFSPAFSKICQFVPSKFGRQSMSSLFALSLLWMIIRRFLSHYHSSYETPRLPSDQGYYLMMYEAFVKGTFSATEYMYGLGYPGAALLFKFINHSDPFFALNLSLYIGTAISGFFILRTSIKSIILAAAGAAAIFGNSYVIEFTARPWTSSVTAFAITLTAAMIQAQNPLVSKWRFGKLATLSILTVWTFASRYVDVIIFLPIWVLIIYSDYQRHVHTKISVSKVGLYRPNFQLSAAIIFMLLGAFAIFYSHYHYFGAFLSTPYKFHYRPEGGNDQSLSVYATRFGLPQFLHLYGSLVDHLSTSWDSFDLQNKNLRPVFSYFAPLLLVFFWCKINLLKDKIILAFLVSAGCFLFIYGMHPGTAPGCLQFGSAHYFKWIYVFTSIGAVLVLFKMMSLEIKPIQTLKYLAIVSAIYGFNWLMLGFLVPKDFRIKKPEILKFEKDQSLVIEYQLINRHGTPIPSFAAKTYGVHLTVNSKEGSERINGDIIEGDYSRGLVVIDNKYTNSADSLTISGWTTSPKTILDVGNP